MTEDTKATASPLDDLLAAKEHSDKGDYGSKTHLVRNLLHKFPKDFVVDTPEGQFVGITHVPTGFKMHISRAVVPLELFKNQREILKSQNDIVKAKRDMMSPQLEALKEQQKQEQEAVKAQQKRLEQAVQQEQEQLKKEEGKRRHAAAVNAFTTAYDRSNDADDEEHDKSASAQVLQAAGVPVKDPTEILPGGRMDASDDITAKPKDPSIPTTGPAAIAYRLKNLDLAAIEQKQRDLIKSGKVSKRSNAVKTLNILEGFKRNNLTGADLTINKVPVIPPVFRPFRMAGSTFVPGDANELYRDLFTMKKLHKEVADELGEENVGDARMGIYNAVKAVYGFGDPVNPKTASRGVTGFFKKVTGTNPKYCYDSETEILTRKYGWVFFKDLTEDTEVATLNPETGGLNGKCRMRMYMHHLKVRW